MNHRVIIGLFSLGCLAMTSLLALAAGWTNVSGVSIPLPPPEHPRLYFRTENVSALPSRLADPVLKPVVARLETLARKSPQFAVEWAALQHLAKPDNVTGRETIERTLAMLKKAELPDHQDACRVTGRWMVTGAIVYDWLHPMITPEEKRTFVQELIRLAKTLECGYPPTRQGSVTGHSSEAMIMRDLLSAGIAIFNEFPEMYQLAAGRFFKEHLPARNWFYHGQAYHQGDSYGAHRYSWDTFPLFIFDRLGAGNVYNPEQRFVPYLWVYTTRPDGQRLRAGDTFMHSTARGQPWSEFNGTLFTASYYGDGTLLSQHLQQGGVGDSEAIFELLWRDTTLQPKPISALPLSSYFGSPFGWMVARTGWGDNAVVAEMKINEYNFANHQHLDAGAFQLYYKGALAIDSGLYAGLSGKYGSPHCRNYYWRTIAHNALLIHNTSERFSARDDYGNDGGQRLPHGRSEPRTLDELLSPAAGYRTGKVLAHGFGPDVQSPDYTLLQGDLTAAYSAKVKGVNRAFIFLNLREAEVPAALIVFDRVVSAEATFRKFWLLHTLEEPRLSGMRATVDRTNHGAKGRLYLDVLLPVANNAELSKVGGPGHEFWVFGTNYANEPDPARVKQGSIEAGQWRLELSPRAAAAEDFFLTVMQVTDMATPRPRPIARMDTTDRTGCVIKGTDANWIVLLRKDCARSESPVHFNATGSATCHILVADLSPGHWQAQRVGSTFVQSVEVSADSGVAWFEGSAGDWTLRRSASQP